MSASALLLTITQFGQKYTYLKFDSYCTRLSYALFHCCNDNDSEFALPFPRNGFAGKGGGAGVDYLARSFALATRLVVAMELVALVGPGSYLVFVGPLLDGSAFKL